MTAHVKEVAVRLVSVLFSQMSCNHDKILLNFCSLVSSAIDRLTVTQHLYFCKGEDADLDSLPPLKNYYAN